MVSAAGQPLGFFDGLIDGMLARRFWDPERASREKTVDYILGELWATATQPLAALAALLDWEALRQRDLGVRNAGNGRA